jgi:hypothetical protein
MISAATLATSLFATICIDGTLHGQSQTMCHEFQLSHRFPTVEACERGRKAAIDEWLTSIAFMQPHLVAERCGPAEPEGDGDDI